MGKRKIIQEEDKKAEQIKKEKDPITLFISLFSNQASKLKQMNVYHEWRKEMSTKEFLFLVEKGMNFVRNKWKPYQLKDFCEYFTKDNLMLFLTREPSPLVSLQKHALLLTLMNKRFIKDYINLLTLEPKDIIPFNNI